MILYTQHTWQNAFCDHRRAQREGWLDGSNKLCRANEHICLKTACYTRGILYYEDRFCDHRGVQQDFGIDLGEPYCDHRADLVEGGLEEYSLHSLCRSRRPSWRSRSRTCRAVFGSDRPLRAPFRPSLGAGPGPRRCRLAPGEPARRRRRSGGARFVPGPRTPPRAPRPRPGEGTGGRSRRAAERRRQSNSSRAAAARSEQRDTRCDDSHAQIS
ncbi:hypothetical protein TNCT_190761 [Trichonephila clavata]|uniref:Uncharacterized protein n=1 Tax=Trichonephila clavata TaxID=2740835 RepID=A0A8X6K9R2_TRICU|nr:hypothetical protein TNCT_190761 [Trichonephila clavata]